MNWQSVIRAREPRSENWAQRQCKKTEYIYVYVYFYLSISMYLYLSIYIYIHILVMHRRRVSRSVAAAS